ncbi:hypothetical protein, partial [Streptomyces sp. JJ36]|uniref:hypothetical protein n=1 Tax=Streptomyces sp. JJ36 TaxID=2736645 RepID=UPI001F3D9654
MAGGIYVERRIRAGMELLWERTQDPVRHQRWDLRFTEIVALEGAEGAEKPGRPEAPEAPGRPDGPGVSGGEGRPVRFRYATRVVPGLVIAGTGVSAGERRRPDGTRTSALRFRSPHPLSLLAEGSGYWRYVPAGEPEDGIRFLTGYDYRPRWGRPGRVADRWVFRPLMGWATAWSFDRLRLWCERGVRPERALRQALGEALGRSAAVAAAVVYAAGSPSAAALGAVFAVVSLALGLPPLPRTPAARRCLRRPPRVAVPGGPAR